MSMLVAYKEDGEIIATLDFCVVRDNDGNVIGVIDFAETEASGTELTNIWRVDGAIGSGSVPEKMDSRIYNYKVEVDDAFTTKKARGERPERRIKRLVRKSLED